MADIIDFKSHVQQRMIHEALPDLPDIPIIHEASEIFGDKLFRLLLLGQLCLEANDAIIRQGWDPVDFHIDDPSVDRFMTTDHLDDEEAMFNGVFFDWLTEQGVLIRIATSVVIEDGNPAPSLIDILRIGPDDDYWEILDEGEWSDDGPPAEFFEFLEDAWEGEAGGAVDAEDVEDTDATEDRSIAQLPISVETYNRLDAAGIETIDELVGLKTKTVSALVGDDGFKEIQEGMGKI